MSHGTTLESPGVDRKRIPRNDRTLGSEWRLRSGVFLLGLLLTAGRSFAADLTGTWQGAIELPGMGLIIVVQLDQRGEEWSGTIDIPAQGVERRPLTDIVVEHNRVEFMIKDVPGDPKFTGWLIVDKIEGTFSQAGQNFKFHLTRPEARSGRVPSQSTQPGGPSKGSAEEAVDFSGHWEGQIEVQGKAAPLLVDLAQKEGVWSGSADSPKEGARGIPLEPLRVQGAEIEFTLKGADGNPTYRGRLEDGKIKGTVSVSGLELPLVLGREKVIPPARPQEPKPPFPYLAEEVTFQSGAITLAGTLTIPSGDGPFPAVLLITGSGSQNRDEEVFGHKPFLVLADYLTRGGIAVLRIDDRGVGGSSGGDTQATTADLAGDALAGVRFLKEHPGIDPGRIGLLGHSEGGEIAPMAAAQSPDVAYIVLLAGLGVPGGELLSRQTELMYTRAGIPEEKMRPALDEHRKALDLVRAGADSTQLRAQVEKMIRAQLAAQSTARTLSQDELDVSVDTALKQLMHPWMRYFITHDPRPTLRQVRVPVLALNGELDVQVDPDQNLPEIRKALEEGGNRDVTVRELPGLNHLFQKAQTGSLDEYAQIEETMNPEALEAVRQWIQKQTAR